MSSLTKNCPNLEKNPNILKICDKYNIKITWIPREINVVADKVAKLQPTKKDDTFYTIDFIYLVPGFNIGIIDLHKI